MAPRGRLLSTYLFDLDGTLINSIELIMSSFRHTMLVHLGEVPADHEWRSGFGTPLRTQLAKFACDTEQADAMRATFVEYSDKHHDRMVEVYPGVREALENLCAREAVRLAIGTSKNRRGTRRGLQLCGLEQYFDVFVTADDVDKYKPDPAPVIAALDQLAVGASEAVFIGDSPHDIAAGRSAGVQTAAVLWGPFTRQALAHQPPDHWLMCPADINTLS